MHAGGSCRWHAAPAIRPLPSFDMTQASLPPPSPQDDRDAPAASPSPAVNPPANNTLAIVSLVFGVLGWSLLPVLGGIVAIVTGHMARSQLAASPQRETGDVLALIGLLLGYLSVGLAVLAVVLVLMILFGGAGLLFWAS